MDVIWYQCAECPNSYKCVKSFERHKRLHTGTGLVCEHCAKMFSTRCKLEAHYDSRLHDDQFTVACALDGCTKMCRDEGSHGGVDYGIPTEGLCCF